MSRLFIDPNIAKASTISTDIYTSAENFDAAKEKIFAPSWQFVGHDSLAAEPGDVYPFTLLENYLNEPLVFTRDKESKLNLLSNVCTHRGNIVADKPCNASHLRCKYHGRQFQ